MELPRFVAYYRVSTDKQGRSGLGLEAQQRAVAQHLAATGGELIASFTEVESGKRADRVQLQEAVQRSRLTGATLLIAKLDRLSRNAAFLLNLRDSGVRFVACDMPHANELTIGIMALVAEEEARMISRRTKEALQSWRERNPGKRLGNPNGWTTRIPGVGARARAAQANAYALRLKPVVQPLRESGASMAMIAQRLTEMQIRTPLGGAWNRKSVANVLRRIQAAAEAQP